MPRCIGLATCQAAGLQVAIHADPRQGFDPDLPHHPSSLYLAMDTSTPK
jgi:hypothetical protein